MKALKIIFLLLITLTITSCTFYDNDVEGTADVVYSSTIVIKKADFVAEDKFISVANYGWDNLDEEIVDYGMVLGYLRFEGTTSWQALPFAVPFENDLVNLRYNFDIENFSLVIEGEVAENNDANEALFNRDVLRIIAIPPTVIAKGKGIDYRNYEQVIELYHLDKQKKS
jgi:hypothetical protein